MITAHKEYEPNDPRKDGRLLERYNRLTDEKRAFIDACAEHFVKEVQAMAKANYKKARFGVDSARLIVLRYQAGQVIAPEKMQYAESRKE